MSGYRDSGAIDDGVGPVGPGEDDCVDPDPDPAPDPDVFDFASASLLLFSNAARNCCSSCSSRDNVSFWGLDCGDAVDGSSLGDGDFDHQPIVYSV